MKKPKLSQKSLTQQEAWDKVHGHLPLHFINEKFPLSQQLMPCSKLLFIPLQAGRNGVRANSYPSVGFPGLDAKVMELGKTNHTLNSNISCAKDYKKRWFWNTQQKPHVCLLSPSCSPKEQHNTKQSCRKTSALLPHLGCQCFPVGVKAARTMKSHF